MLGDKLRENNTNTTPTPTRSRRSITPSKSPSPNALPNEDCGSAHSHKRCSCFHRPRPPPQLENSSPLPRLRKKTSSASIMSNHAPYSSSPTTPDKSRHGRGKPFTFDENFSTTPAGPPPSSAGSFTPAGPPPSSSYMGSSMIPQPVFGSSRSGGSSRSLQFGTPVGQTPKLPKLKPGQGAMYLNESFNKPIHGPFSSPSAKRYNQQKAAEQERAQKRERMILNRDPTALQPNNFFQPPPDDDEMEEDDETYDSRGGDDDNLAEDDYDSRVDSMADFRESMMAGEDIMVEGEYDEVDEYAELARLEKQVTRRAEDDDDNSDLLLPTPGRFRNSANEGNRFGDTMRDTEEDLEYQNIARDMYKRAQIPGIRESDDLLLRTEELVMKVYDEGLREAESSEVLGRALNEASRELVELWDTYQYLTAPSATDEYDLGIGPDPAHSPFANANFLAGLLLQLHLPPISNTATFGLSRTSFRNSIQSQAAHKDKPIPATLLEWINQHHNPMPALLNDLHRHKPSPSASRTFWKDIQSGLLRGKVADVAQILKNAGWEYARETGSDHPRGATGFHGQALDNVEKEVMALVNLLEEYCPAVRGDWNTQNSDWKLFRLRADNALGKLKEFAEGGDRDNEFRHGSSRNSRFALDSRIAESKVPWSVLQNLKVLYSIISGSCDPIIESATDWCEATVGMVAWWDEGKEDQRVVLGRSHLGGNDGDTGYYLRKLKRSVKRAMRSTSGFQVNTMNPVEIGLVCVFRGDVEAAIGMIRTWSLPLAAAVAEIAALGNWLPRTEPRSLITMEAFDLQDLELLGLTGPNDRNDGIKDNTLNHYASALATYHQLKSKDATIKIVRDSWELAIAVLGRLDDSSRSEESVGLLLDRIPVESTETLDKLLLLLKHLGLTHHAETQAEKYADHLATDTQRYGEALWYYARAHKPKKVKDVLGLLTSYCLVESRSLPVFNDLDTHLKRLISDKQAILEELEKIDSEASQLIQKYLSGYAVLRQYYDSRDEQIMATEQNKVAKWQGNKNKASLQRLITLINSAADNIRGGLFDESCDAVLPIEFLLVLLGEVLPFISQPATESIITIQHLEVLLRAIEDVQTVTSRVYDTCDDFFMTVLASARGLKGNSPSDMLTRSTESGLGQSQFSLVGSSMVASQLRKSMSSSGILVSKGDVKRGWDWRRGFKAGTTSQEVLSILRLGIAKDLARCWIAEADCGF